MRKNLTINKQKSHKKETGKSWTLLPLLWMFIFAGSVMAQDGQILKEETLSICRSHLLPIDLNDVIGVSIPAGSGNWYDGSTNEIVSNVLIPEAINDTLEYYFLVESKAALCELKVGERYKVNIIINDIPTPVGEEEQIFCYTPGEQLTLKNLSVAGENIAWYDEAIEGNLLGEKTLLADGAIYYATQVEPGCGESSARLAVTVVLDTTPDILVDDPGEQVYDFNLEELEITDNNNTNGTITFHSELPEAAEDMSTLLTNAIITASQNIFVMKATANGCYDVEEIQILIDISQNCNYKIVLEDIQHIECFDGNEGAISLSVLNSSGDSAEFSYLWSTNDTTASIDQLPAGEYSVIITSSNKECSVLKDTFWIEQPDMLEIVMEIIEESAPNAGDAQATAKVRGGTPFYEYLWNDESQQRTATAINLGGGEYKVVVTDANGCQVEGTAIIKDKLFIPEGFSPNNDGINDYFEISGLEDYPEARIEIYNRWNNIVYAKDGYGNESRWGIADAWWDGRSNQKFTVGSDLLPAGTYIYILKLRPDQSEVKKGIIFINR